MVFGPSLIEVHQSEFLGLEQLRRALFRGGITQEVLDVLLKESDESDVSFSPSRSFSPLTQSTKTGTDSNSPPSQSTVRFTVTRPRGSTYKSDYETRFMGTDNGVALPRHSRSYGNSENDSSFQSERPSDHPDAEGETLTQQRLYPRQDRRSIFLSNLSDKTTHKDIVSVVRGGALLDVYLRNDHNASIAFVDGEAAQRFMDYAKRNDIYLHDRRIDFRWADRHFILAPHVAKKIANGATRNILIRNVNNRLSATQLRDDLEHISNLIVIDVVFSNTPPNSCRVETNSVHNAMYARTCLMSRASYRGMLMEWASDECSTRPLDHFGGNRGLHPVGGVNVREQFHRQPARSRPAQHTTTAKPPPPPTNRFDLLSMMTGDEDREDESNDDDDENEREKKQRHVALVDGLVGIPAFEKDVRWADGGIAAV